MLKTCKYCSHPQTAYGLSRPVLVCGDKDGFYKKLYIVWAMETCVNFKPNANLQQQIERVKVSDDVCFIPLSRGMFATVDVEDYPELNKYTWTVRKEGNTYYANRTKRVGDRRKQEIMHRKITNAPDGLVVDHINHDGLDNRKQNLRVCTRKQNSRNQLPYKNVTSKYKGVYWEKQSKCYRASVRKDGKLYNLGRFKDQKEAAKAYDERAVELFGEFAYLNFPQG